MFQTVVAFLIDSDEHGLQIECLVNCKKGFMYSNGKCEDINECDSIPCHQHAVCNNSLGMRPLIFKYQDTCG